MLNLASSHRCPHRLPTLPLFSTLLLCVGALTMPKDARALNGAVSRSMIISQVYGGGGNTSASYRNDFVELVNISHTAIDVSAWSIQYQTDTGTTWTIVNLCSSTTAETCVVQPGHFYLVQLASGGAVGASLPTPDAPSSTLNIAAAQGKIALVNSRTSLTTGSNVCGSLPVAGSPAVIDFVGYGTNTNPCSETSPAPTMNTNAKSIVRASAQDTDNNSTDFSVISPPTPRNSSSTPITPTAASVAISGQVLTKDGAPLGGVTVRLGGTKSDVTITARDGAYRFDDLEAGGFYTITPQLANFNFAPPSRAFSLAANKADAVFTAEASADSNANAIDANEFFVRQQYLDFLNREPDAEGFKYWINQINSCGADAACLDAKRQNVSAAYFLSTEFQETGFFVIRINRVAFGRRSNDARSRLAYEEFVRDSQAVGAGVRIGRADAETLLDRNKTAYARSIAASENFTNAFPTTLAADDFVDALCRRAEIALTADERQTAIAAFGAGDEAGRAAALKTIADADSVRRSEFAAGFVLMQYFGYLRRNPTDAPDSSDAGYQFWFGKLNEADGDYIRSEMVRAFIISAEYRRRFGAQ
jgi:hypothetical protein